VFKNAQYIKVDPDKPLQQARYVTLKVPTPCYTYTRGYIEHLSV